MGLQPNMAPSGGAWLHVHLRSQQENRCAENIIILVVVAVVVVFVVLLSLLLLLILSLSLL